METQSEYMHWKDIKQQKQECVHFFNVKANLGSRSLEIETFMLDALHNLIEVWFKTNKKT